MARNADRKKDFLLIFQAGLGRWWNEDESRHTTHNKSFQGLYRNEVTLIFLKSILNLLLHWERFHLFNLVVFLRGFRLPTCSWTFAWFCWWMVTLNFVMELQQAQPVHCCSRLPSHRAEGSWRRKSCLCFPCATKCWTWTLVVGLIWISRCFDCCSATMS